MGPKARLTSTLDGMRHRGGWVCLTSLLVGGRGVWHPSFLCLVYNSLCFAYSEVKKKKIVIKENTREKRKSLCNKQWPSTRTFSRQATSKSLNLSPYTYMRGVSEFILHSHKD